MAFVWQNVLVAPTGSSGLTSGSFTAVDEDPPWNDADTCFLQLSSLASGTAIFNGFDLSLGPGDKKGFWLWLRMSNNAANGFDLTLTLKQDTTTLWTSGQFLHNPAAQRTYMIRVPDSAFSGNPDIDNLSIEIAAVNLQASNQRLSFSWVRISKSPFTAAQEAVLPSTLVGQDFTCYRVSDIGVLGGADAESLFLLPDASGNGRHAILRVAGATYETDAPEGILADSARFVGSLGYDPATEAVIKWTGNNIFHFKVYPTSLATEVAVFSVANTADFIGDGVGNKNILGASSTAGWTLMSGDGSGPAHLNGGTASTDVEQRVTEWIQVGGGNEHLWEEDDASPVVDGSSGDNAFYSWSLLDRETDDRSFVGRMMEAWFVEATGISEADIDTARDEWVNGIGGGPTTFFITPSGAITPAGGLLKEAQSRKTGSLTPAGALLREPQKRVAGSIASSGTLTREPQKQHAGSLTPAGTVTKHSPRTYAGAITPTGALTKESPRSFAGSISSSGALVRETQKRFSAGISPSGDLRRTLDRLLSGAITPTGLLLKRVGKSFTGAITPSGTVATQIVIQRAFSGAITMAGILLKSLTRTFAGSVTPTGSLTQRSPRSYAGTITPTGSLNKETQKTFAGSITPTGALTRKVGKVLSGTITSAGIVARRVGKFFTGSITPTGSASHIKSGGLVLGGSITPAGNLTRQLARTVTGSLTPIGVLTRKLSRSFAGSLTPAGTVSNIRKILISLSGTLSLAGTVTRRIGKTFTAAIAPTGSVTRRLIKTFTGVILPTATLNVSRIFHIALQGIISFVGNVTTVFVSGDAIAFVRDRRDWLLRRRDYDPKDRVYKFKRRDYR